ncbi:MAG: glycosyltransferase, partial [Planctomycetes bacterium]|nr:glycosyltransferase [Planctomycetota bacterium]
ASVRIRNPKREVTRRACRNGGTMKIVEVVHGYPPEVVGGTERYVQKITESLRDRNHQLFVFSGSLNWMENFTVEAVEKQGYELTTVHRNDLYFDRWDKAFNPLVAENFAQYLAEHKPDVVHIHHWVRLSSNLAVVAAGMGFPVVVTLHDLYVTCPRFFRMKEDGSYCVLPLSPENCLKSADRWLFQRDPEIRSALNTFKTDVAAELAAATRVLAPSSTHASTVKDRLGAEAVEIDVLPMGRLSALKPAPRPGPGGKLVVVYFSHLYPFKGPKILLEAFKKMVHKDETELHLFGGEVLPEFAEELKTFARGLDVTFHGPYVPEDLEKFPMDVVVLPTQLAESYSFILDEASDLGAPIVACEVGAIPERLGKSGLLFRRGDVDGLARILDRLASDRSVLDELRAAGPVSTLSMEEHINRLEAVYKEAIEEGARSGIQDRTVVHLRDQWERREYGFKELIRSEQWESLVASLRKRIVELEVELAQKRNP